MSNKICAFVRCPGHIIQFLNYGYSQYIKKVSELVEINPVDELFENSDN